MRKMRNLNVFSIFAVLALVFILGCGFTSIDNVDKDAKAVVENNVVLTQSDNETSISSAVFVNPELVEDNETDFTDEAADDASKTSSAVFINPDLIVANN